MLRRIVFPAWLLLVLLALFPVLAAISDLVADLRGGLPADHQAAFAAVAGQSWDSASRSAAGVATYVNLLETGYALHELVFGVLFLAIVAVPIRRGEWWAWWASWVVLVADVGYTLTFASYDPTLLGRSLVADVGLPVLLLAQVPGLGRRQSRAKG